ncbi:hypothetical protein D9M68_886550 [compost metagenome]
MSNELCTIEKRHEFIDNVCKARFSEQLLIGNAVNRKCIGMNLATLWIDEFVEGAARGKAIDHFHTADFDDAILQPFKASGFRIENDLTHGKTFQMMLYC